MEYTGTLSVVATPIGNLEDITLRAIRVLRECDYILCEDTRVTGRLLERHGITTHARRYDAHTSERVHQDIIADVQQGKHIALVSDAGTPGVSDPGVLLVARVRDEVPDARLEVIPGPSAVTAAFSIAGIPGNQFCFWGFVPQKKGRETFFKRLAAAKQPVIFFESPHRIVKTLESLEEHVAHKCLYLGRELTKRFEEMIVGSPAEVRTRVLANPHRQKGEFVVIVA